MANNRNNQGPQDLKLDMSSEVANGTYSNLAIISHSPSEIILDFAQSRSTSAPSEPLSTLSPPSTQTLFLTTSSGKLDH